MERFLAAKIGAADIIEGETRHADGSRLVRVRRYAGRVPLWAVDIYIPPRADLGRYRSRAADITLPK